MQVVPSLAEVLPNAVLAAVELVYLGGLPRHTQQQLLAKFKQAIKVAVAVRSGSAAGNTGSLLGGAITTSVAQAAAGTGRTRRAVQGECCCHRSMHLLQLLKQHKALPLPSQLMEKLQLLQPEGPLCQRLLFAAVAAAVAAGVGGRPLLVVDPWQLLPQLWSEQHERAPHEQHEWTVLDVGVSGSNSISNGGSGNMNSSGRMTPAGALTAVQAALQSQSNVCLRLHGCSAADAAVVQAAAAAYSLVQLQATEVEDGTGGHGAEDGTQLFSEPATAALTYCMPERWNCSRPAQSKRRSTDLGRGLHGRASCCGSPTSVGCTAESGGCPRLLIHVCSSSVCVPAGLVGTCQVVHLGDGGLWDLSHQASETSYGSAATAAPGGTFNCCEQVQDAQQLAQKQQQQQQSIAYLAEVVLRLALGTVAPDSVAAAAAATAAVEQAAAQLQSDESQLMTRLSQVSAVLDGRRRFEQRGFSAKGVVLCDPPVLVFIIACTASAAPSRRSAGRVANGLLWGTGCAGMFAHSQL